MATTYEERPIDRAGHALTALTAVRDLVGGTPHQMEISGDNLAMLLRLIEEKLDGALHDMSSQPKSNLRAVK